MYRKSMLFGRTDFNVQQFSLLNFPGVGLQPAAAVCNSGNRPTPPGLPAVIVRLADDSWNNTPGPDHLELFQLTLDWINMSNSTISGPLNLVTAAFNSKLCENGTLCIPQRDTPAKLNAFSQQLMDKMEYRNFDDHESIVGTHTVNADGLGKAGLRWYELRRNANGDWFIYQQGTYSYNSENRFLGSAAINGKGSIALGYLTSSAKTSPGIRITGRDSCDIANAMTVSEMMVEITNGYSPSSKYADYTAMCADPADNSFWFSANYVAGTSWATSVAHFNFTNCPVVNKRAARDGVSSADMMIRKIRISLHPSQNEVAIGYECFADMRVPVQITDLSGHLLLESMQDVKVGNNVAHFNIEKIANGSYFVRIGASGAAVQRMVILRSVE
jgi:hypothetical protein